MGGSRSLSVEYQNQEFIVLDEWVENRLLRRQETDVQRFNGLAVLPGVAGECHRDVCRPAPLAELNFQFIQKSQET